MPDNKNWSKGLIMFSFVRMITFILCVNVFVGRYNLKRGVNRDDGQ